MRQSREAASLQAIARIRAVTAAEAKRIVVLCSIPLADLPVTELAPWNALVAGADPDTQTRAFARMRAALRRPGDGALVEDLRLSPAGLRDDAAWAFRETTAAANWHRALGSAKVLTLATKALTLEGASPALVRLRHAGGGKPTPALVVSPGACAVATAERIWRGWRAELP